MIFDGWVTFFMENWASWVRNSLFSKCFIWQDRLHFLENWKNRGFEYRLLWCWNERLQGFTNWLWERMQWTDMETSTWMPRAQFVAPPTTYLARGCPHRPLVFEKPIPTEVYDGWHRVANESILDYVCHDFERCSTTKALKKRPLCVNTRNPCVGWKQFSTPLDA